MINVHIAGRGAVFADNKTSLHCAFVMTQGSDARLFLDCVCDDAHAGWILYSATNLRLEGTTDSGEVVRVDGLRVIDLDGQRCMCAGDTAIIGTSASEGDNYEFALVNLIFPGTTRRSLPEPILLSLAVDETSIEVLLRPRPDYIDRHIAVRRTKQPEVTAILEVETPKGFDWTAQMATDLCDALSVTNGTKINWISCRIRGFDGSEQLILHNRVTKPYSPLPLNQHGGNNK
ncbi:MAG TPA: hypothetical protein VEX68_21240 [Bryobacteraceae bacterium]|nr:hypothetical protein [Bryobacteraceae bacterium]